jgi:hypothetical protein
VKLNQCRTPSVEKAHQTRDFPFTTRCVFVK